MAVSVESAACRKAKCVNACSRGNLRMYQMCSTMPTTTALRVLLDLDIINKINKFRAT
jgi:hypothetical protein